MEFCAFLSDFFQNLRICQKEWLKQGYGKGNLLWHHNSIGYHCMVKDIMVRISKTELICKNFKA